MAVIFLKKRLEDLLRVVDEPILLTDLYRSYGISTKGVPRVWVRRCVLLRRDLIRFVFGKPIDLRVDQVNKAMFASIEEGFREVWDYQNSPRKKFKQQISGRWYTRRGCSRAGYSCGFEIVDSEDEDLIG